MPFSPSRLITVTFWRSMTSLRPCSPSPAPLHVRFSSVSHGSISFPSTTRRRSVFVSIVEIFNMLLVQQKGGGNTAAKGKVVPSARKSLRSMRAEKKRGRLCRNCRGRLRHLSRGFDKLPRCQEGQNKASSVGK